MRESGVKQFGGIELTPRALSSRYYARRAVIRETEEMVGDRRIYAYCGLWRSSNEYQVGPLYLAPDWRTPHMGLEILRETLMLMPLGTSAFIVLDARSCAYDAAVVCASVERLLDEGAGCNLTVLHGKPH